MDDFKVKVVMRIFSSRFLLITFHKNTIHTKYLASKLLFNMHQKINITLNMWLKAALLWPNGGTAVNIWFFLH